jgi:uncharacterized protein (TIGR02145 family)
MRTYYNSSVFLLLMVGLFILSSSGCKKKDDNGPAPVPKTVTDFDGNIYHTVVIGTQVWLAENLNVTHYRNGDALLNANTVNAWTTHRGGACCDYNDVPGNGSVYGKLYDFAAVSDAKKLCPAGWHVPRNDEWVALRTYLAGDPGGKLKEAGTTHWLSPNAGATNETGFWALPGGDRHTDGVFYDLGIYGTWWSSTPSGTGKSIYWGMNNYDTSLAGADYNPAAGFSVRCIMD